MRRSWALLSVTWIACGGASLPKEPAHAPEPAPAALVETPPAPPPPAEQEEHAESRVKVRGIEGSMNGHDVRTTMEEQNDQLAACHEPRARVNPALSGEVEYGIKVDGEGRVGEVTVRRSDLGDRTHERCVSEVIARTPFPRPNGGDARFTWTLSLEPAYASAVPEAWEAEQIEKVIDKRMAALHADCNVESQARHLGATAYINKRGRVVAASVTGKSAASEEDLDCIVLELRKWPMPKPKHSRFAKVSFSLKASQPALAQRRPSRKR